MRIILTCISALVLCTSFAQIQNPVQWSYHAKKISDKTYELHATASIEPGWHIYSQTTGKGGPVPTRFIFTQNPLAVLTGTPKELGKPEKVFDKNFNAIVKYYSHKVDFVQTIKLKAAVKTNVTGVVEFMVCNDKNCLPPKKVSFNVSLP